MQISLFFGCFPYEKLPCRNFADGQTLSVLFSLAVALISQH